MCFILIYVCLIQKNETDQVFKLCETLEFFFILMPMQFFQNKCTNEFSVCVFFFFFVCFLFFFSFFIIVKSRINIYL